MNEIDQLEQELAGLRQRFAQSLQILEELAHIKKKFDGLSDTHQALQMSLEQAKTVLETFASDPLEPRLAQLETQVDTRHDQLQAQLTNFRFDFESLIRQVRQELAQAQENLTDLKHNSEKSSPDSDDPNRVKWLESSLQHLNSSIYSDHALLQKLDRRINHLKRTIDVIAVVGFVGFMVVGLMFLVLRP